MKTKFSGRKILSLLSGVSIAIIGSTPISLAQEADQADETVSLDTVTVFGTRRADTAFKTDTALVETPQSISVLPEALLEARQVSSLSDALKSVAGVTTEFFGAKNANYDRLAIRGFDVTQFVLQDGLRRSVAGFPAPSLEVTAVERLEVLKGPASILYGQTAPGGIVNAVSKVADGRNETSLRLEGGDFDYYEVAGDIERTLNSDGSVSARLIAVYRSEGSFLDNGQDNTRLFISPSINWDISDRTSLTFKADYYDDEFDPTFFTVPVEGSLLTNPNGVLPSDFYIGEPGRTPANSEDLTIGYQLEHEFSDNITLRHSLRYRTFDYEAPFIYSIGLTDDLAFVNRGYQPSVYDSKDLVTDTSILAEFAHGNVEHQVLVGVDYQNGKTTFNEGFGEFAQPLDLFNPQYGAPFPDAPVFFDFEDSVDDLGIYFQDQVRIADKLILTLGGRFNITETRGEDRLANFVETQDTDEFSLRAAAMYRFDSGFAPYISYSESFVPIAGRDRTGDQFVPEIGTQYEAGVKFELGEGAVNGVVSVFQIELDNVLTSDPVNPVFEVQTGQQRHTGFEAEIAGEIFEDFQVFAGYSYLDAEISETNDLDVLGLQPDLIAKHSFSAFASWEPSGDRLNGLELGGGVRYRGEQEVLFVDETVDSNTLVDANIAYTHKNVRYSLTAKNLLDEDFIASCQFFGCAFGEPRRVIGSVTINF